MTAHYRIVSLEKDREHQTESGGYDRLARELNAEPVRRPARSGATLHRIARECWRFYGRLRRHESYFFDYRYEDWLAGRTLLSKVRKDPQALVHVLYGDGGQSHFLIQHREQLPCPLVVTFHTPRDKPRVVRRFQRYHQALRHGIDAAIAVARCQLPDLRRWLKSDRVHYVPHGIDVQRFVPNGSHRQRAELKLISVGSCLRDFKTLHHVIRESRARGFAAHFDLVVPGVEAGFFNDLANVRVHQRISEAELIRLYQDADAALLPLLDATANNSILESLACGTPVISTSVGGVPDYLDEESGWLFPPGEAQGMIELIASMCRRPEIASNKRAGARHKALEFDWAPIVSKTRSVYEAARAARAGQG